MHELSVSINILSIVQDVAEKNNLTKVIELVLEIGTLTCIDDAVLIQAMEINNVNTVLDDANVIIKRIPPRACCQNCKQEFDPVATNYVCPLCQNKFYEIIKGKELQIKTMSGI